eukprot:1156066-Pelagomonas_calceolata.AAC.3
MALHCLIMWGTACFASAAQVVKPTLLAWTRGFSTCSRRCACVDCSQIKPVSWLIVGRRGKLGVRESVCASSYNSLTQVGNTEGAILVSPGNKLLLEVQGEAARACNKELDELQQRAS